MLQVNYIRQNPALVKERLAARNFAKIDLVDSILQADEELRKIRTASENLQAAVNAISKEVGMLMAKGDKTTAEQKKQEVAALKIDFTAKATELQSLERSFNDQLLQLPNLPHSS